MKPKHILITLCLLCLLLLPAAAAADAVTYSGKTYTTYDQIYASTTLSSSEKLQLVQEMAGWTEELEAYMEWKNSGGLEAYQAAVSGGNTTNSTGTSSDYGWNEAPGDGLGEGGNIEPEYSYQERQAYDAAYAAYQQEFAMNYAATAAYPGSGSGTQADPYIVTTPAELQAMQDDLTAYYKLGNDIDLTGFSFTPIGISSPFTGNFNGDGYTISNLVLSLSIRYVGLFSHISGNAEIYNLKLSNFDITGLTRVGCLCGFVAGSDTNNIDIYNILVLDSSVTASTSSSTSADSGVICGAVDYGVINNCYVISSSVDVSNSRNGGALFGFTVYSNFNHCYCVDMHVYAGNAGVEQYDGSGILSGNGVIRTLSNVYSSGVIDGDGDYISRVIGGTPNNPNPSLTGIYSDPNSKVNGNIITGGSPTSKKGQNIATSSITQSFFEDTLGFDFVDTWYWDASATWQDATGTTYTGLPHLQVFLKSVPPTISAVSCSPSTGGQETTYTLSTSATTTGQGGISGYQWYVRIGSSGSWQAISGATSATYTFVPGSYAIGDLYFKVVVTGADGGTADSYDAGFTNVKATVVLAPQITSPAASPAEGPLTQTVTLSASVTSTESVTYQWEEQISGTWTAISGATSATSTVTVSDSAATTHSYRLAASNVGGTAYSSTVTYQSVAPPTFSAVSASPSQGTYTSTVQLSATVSGSDSLQWQELVGSSWQNINGATSAVYSLTLTDTAATLHSYRLAATNIGGTAYSSTVTYQSVAPPVFSAFQVSPLSGGVPLSVSFSATASDTSGYRWEYSTDGTIWVQMASGASGSYTFTAEGVYYIRVIAIGTGGSTTSASATVTASVLLPEFTQISASPTSGVAPFAVTLSASATNDATFVWQMQSGSSWVQIGSGSPLTYTIPSGTSAGMVYFRAVATNQYGSTTSQTLAVEVGAAPAAEIASPAPGAVFGSNRLISFAAADAGAGVTYSWNFGDGQTGSGKTVTHSYSETGFFMVTLTTSSQFGSSEDVVRIEIVEATGDIWLAVSDISSTGASVQATVEVSPVDPGTKVWFEVLSESGTVILRSAQLTYSGPVTWEAEGLPMISGETYRVVAKSNYYGYSLPATFTLIDAVQQPHETLGTQWENGLSRDPFNVSLLVSSGIAVFGGSMGGGSVGAAVAFGVIVMFVLVGLWLRQQDVVIPLTLTLVAGWFVIGNLPGEWQPIAYTLMVVAVVAIFFYLFRKRIE